ncbi:MAG: protein kinase domain-containing protein, partial [Planctomycetota bacterium]
MDPEHPFYCPACGEEIPPADPKRASHRCPHCKTVHLLGDLLKNRRWDGALAISSPEIPEDSYTTPGPFQPLPSDQGSTVGAYRLDGLVGEGGMGKVFAARNEATGENVAVKLIHKAYCANPEFIRRFLREGSLLRNIVHKNLVRFVDLGLEDEVYFLAMSFAEGMNLKTLVQEGGPLPLAVALKIAGQAARGLLEAHKNCIMHRDVKPDNVVINRSGNVRVLDFGLARNILSRTTNLTVAGQVIGTPAYMSPEQCDGKPADSRADIYGLGSTLFFSLTGRPPFEGTNNWAIMYKHLNEPIPEVRSLNPAVSEACSELLGKMTAKSPSDRYQTLDCVIDDICLVLAEMRPSLSTEDDGTVLWTRFLDIPSSESALTKALRLQEEIRMEGKYVPPIGELLATDDDPRPGFAAAKGVATARLTCRCGDARPITEGPLACPRCGKAPRSGDAGSLEEMGEYVLIRSEVRRLAYGDLTAGEEWVRLGAELTKTGRKDLILWFPGLVEFGNDQFIWLFDLFESLAPRGGSLSLVIPNERVREQFLAVGAENYIRLFPSKEEFRRLVLSTDAHSEVPGPGETDWREILTTALGLSGTGDPLQAVSFYDGMSHEAPEEPPPGEREFLIKVVASRLTVMGAGAMTEKKFRDAREFFNRALELLPDFPPALLQMGRWFLLRQNFREA